MAWQHRWKREREDSGVSERELVREGSCHGYLCRGDWRGSVEEGIPLGDRAGMVGSPGEGSPAGVPPEDPRGETVAGW